MFLCHCQFFMQKLRTRIVGDLAGRLTPTTFKVSSLQIVNDWNAMNRKLRTLFQIKFYKCILSWDVWSQKVHEILPRFQATQQNEENCYDQIEDEVKDVKKQSESQKPNRPQQGDVTFTDSNKRTCSSPEPSHQSQNLTESHNILDFRSKSFSKLSLDWRSKIHSSTTARLETIRISRYSSAVLVCTITRKMVQVSDWKQG